MTSDVRKIHKSTVIVGGMPVSRLTRAATAEYMIDAALERRNGRAPCLFFTTTNGQVMSMVSSCPKIRALYQQADLISPDGMSVVMASRLFCKNHLSERVATTDAFHDAAIVAEKRGATFFFLGASEEVSRLAVEKVRSLYPSLEIVGRRNGYFTPAQERDVVAEIDRAAPDVLWVAMGVPRQQAFIIRNKSKLTHVGVAKTCGGLFDFLAGKYRRAPDWMQKAGLEWAYRVSQDPRRLFWRYLVTNPHAMYVMALQSGENGKMLRKMVAEGWR